MLLTKLSDYQACDYQKLARAIQFLQTTDLTKTPLGKSHQQGDSFYCQTLEYTTQKITDFDFEIHQQRLDLHYLVEGTEEIDIATDTNVQLLGSYNTQRDLQYVQPPTNYQKIILHAGDLVLIGMHEPHRTNGLVHEPTHMRKIVLKLGSEEG